MTSFICKCMKFPSMTRLSKRALVIPFAIITFENIDQVWAQMLPATIRVNLLHPKPFNSQIKFVILLTDNYTILMILAQRI